jgi:hypothetical protein
MLLGSFLLERLMTGSPVIVMKLFSANPAELLPKGINNKAAGQA